MRRIKALDGYQKGVLLFMLAMVLVFTVLYPVIIGRKGFEYKTCILVLRQEHGDTVYSGKIQGVRASFTVDANKTATRATAPIRPGRIPAPSRRIRSWEEI